MVQRISSNDMLLTHEFNGAKWCIAAPPRSWRRKFGFRENPKKVQFPRKPEKSSVSEKSRESVRNMMSEIRISHYDLVSYELGVPGVRLEENEGEVDRSQMAGCCTEVILN